MLHGGFSTFWSWKDIQDHGATCLRSRGQAEVEAGLYLEVDSTIPEPVCLAAS